MSEREVAQYLKRLEKGRQREIVTPEGVPLRLALATEGDRANAFFIDFAIIMVSVIVLAILAFIAGGTHDASSGWTTGFALLASFLIRNFYFIWFELGWQGRTPGKRWVGLRVVDRAGGALRAEAIIVRNLTREVEVFLPIAVLLAPEQLWPGAPGWARLLSGVWILLFGLMPLFNHDRLRVGDLVAGTMVILAPKALLLEDLGAAARTGGRSERSCKFSDDQLRVYGIYELQILEDLLRGTELGDRESAMSTVADRVKRKIGWPRAQWDVDTEWFLREFYRALRARLEQNMLLGKRREDKYSTE